MISYAQNGEDVLLDRLFPRDVKGFYVDVGANDPVKDSITKHFYDLGWHGINVEPAEAPFRRLVESRPRDLNLNVGVSDAGGTLTLHETQPGTGASTFSPDFADRLREEGITFSQRPVPVLTLAQVFEDHVDGDIDFLTIDVEGYEFQVLAGGDWKRWRPRVVVVEATEPRTTVPSHELWEPTLLDADYLFAAFDGLNRYYVRAEDAHMVEALRTPVNIFDEFDPYGYSKLQEDLRQAYETSQRHLVAARAFNDTLWHEYHDLLKDYGELQPDVSMLQAEFERLQRSLANTRMQYEALSSAVSEAHARYEPLCQEVVQARAGAEAARAWTEATHALVEGVSPGALGVARRVTRLGGRFPGAARTVTRTARVAIAAKRRFSRLGVS